MRSILRGEGDPSPIPPGVTQSHILGPRGVAPGLPYPPAEADSPAKEQSMPVTTRTSVTIDANEAAASVAHRLSEVIAIYPITPSSAMGEWSD